MSSIVIDGEEVKLILYVNAKGEVLQAVVPTGDEPAMRKDNKNERPYHQKERKRMTKKSAHKLGHEPARIATQNWCCWQLIGGRWRCVWPCL